jgi:hypothetical protein
MVRQNQNISLRMRSNLHPVFKPQGVWNSRAQFIAVSCRSIAETATHVRCWLLYYFKSNLGNVRSFRMLFWITRKRLNRGYTVTITSFRIFVIGLWYFIKFITVHIKWQMFNFFAQSAAKVYNITSFRTMVVNPLRMKATQLVFLWQYEYCIAEHYRFVLFFILRRCANCECYIGYII